MGYTDPFERAKLLIGVDALGLAQEIGEKHGVADEDIAKLGNLFLRRVHQEKVMALGELCDTYYRMPWSKVGEVIQSEGFEIVKEHQIDTEQALIAAHPDKKLLLTAESSTFPGEEPVLDYTLNLYGQVETYGDVEKWRAVLDSGGSAKPVKETMYAMHFYPTDGFKIKMQELEDLGIEFIDWLPGKDGPQPTLFFSHRSTEEEVAAREAELRAGLPAWVKSFTKL